MSYLSAGARERAAASDEALMEAYARCGDSTAFAQLYDRWSDRLFGYLARTATAEELFQTLWMRLHAARQSYGRSAATFASLFLLHARGALEGIAPLAIAGGTVAWAGLFTLAFWTLLRRRDADPQLGGLVLGSLSAAGLFLIGNHLLPLPNVVHWCSSHLGARLGPLFFGLGALYAAVPLMLLPIRASRFPPGARSALLAGGFFFILVAPAIFLQCAFFTVGALAAWLLGTVAGSVAGSAARSLFASRSQSAA